jgi:hypothetical protein
VGSPSIETKWQWVFSMMTLARPCIVRRIFAQSEIPLEELNP